MHQKMFTDTIPGKPGLFLGRRQKQCKNGTKSQTTAIFQVGPEIPVLASLQRVGVSIAPQSTRIGAVWEGVLYARLVAEVQLIEGLALKGGIPLVSGVSRTLLLLERVRGGWLFLTPAGTGLSRCSVLSHGSNQLNHRTKTTHHLRFGVPNGSAPLSRGPGPSEDGEGIAPSS